jgi:hypothetical protein
VQREVESVIKTVSDTVRLLLASSLVWVCEAIDENLARWARRRVAKQRTQKNHRGLGPEEGAEPLGLR